MNKILFSISILFVFLSYINTAASEDLKKSKLLGNDYRLFQNTSAWELSKAVVANDTVKLMELIKKNDSLINYQEPKFGKTLLFIAMWYNQVKVFNLLLSLGADPNIHSTYDGTSPLIEACKYDLNKEFITILLKYGAKPDDIEVGVRREGNQTRYTPLIGAVMYGNINIVKTLVDSGANINYMNEFGQTALGQAVILRKLEVIFFLLQKGADFRIPMYKIVDENRPIFIDEALQKINPSPKSDDYKIKMEIIYFLNNHK